MPSPSMWDERQNTVKAGMSRSRSVRKPAKITLRDRPSAAARASSGARSSPSPAITTTTPGSRSRSRAVASIKVAWSLWPVRAATLPTTRLPSGTPRAARASAPPPTGARSGTPSYTSRTRESGMPSACSRSAMARLTAITRSQARYLTREGSERRRKSTRRVAMMRALEPASLRATSPADTAWGSWSCITSGRVSERARTSPRIPKGPRSPWKRAGHVRTPAASARARSSPPARQARVTSCPRSAMPRAVSSTWF